MSSVSASPITTSTATITWFTDEPATSQVEYGMTVSYGLSTTLDTSLVTGHSVNLSGLGTYTTYHYRVKAEDAAGNEAVSEDHSFTTSAAAIAPPEPIYERRVGVGATAYDWFAEHTWQDPRISWNMIDPLSFLAQRGFNWLRAGVTTVSTPALESGPPYPGFWHDEYWCSREYTLQVMRAAANSGMHLDLFFYLSDHAAWAANQKAPTLWEDYSLEETATALKQHTFETAKYYKDRGLKIDLYEIGNEIEFGICGYSIDTKLPLPGVDVLRDYAAVREGVWGKEAILLKAAINGVKEADPQASIVLHVSASQYPDLVRAFFQAMNDFGVPYDFAGLSYYPWTNYHPDVPIPPDCLDLSVQAIAELGKQTVISEVTFPSYTPQAIPVQELPGYEFTLDGQSNWVHDFLLAAENNPNIHSLFYFYPDNYVVSDAGPCALFTDDTHPKPAIYEFAKFQANASDMTSPTIRSISLEPMVLENGDTLEITVLASEAGLYVAVDVSQLDSDKTETIMLKEEKSGEYKGKVVISLGNTIANGTKTLLVYGTDYFGNVGTATTEVRLNNP
jgi:arabinogalactan endo-1,4-beta-galactosidase